MKPDKPLKLDFTLEESNPDNQRDSYGEAQRRLKKQLKKQESLLKEKDITIGQLLDYIKGSFGPTGSIDRKIMRAVNWIGKIYDQRGLTKLADLAGSDKGFRKHLYTTVYQEFIKPEKVKTLLEVGLLCHDDQKALGGGESFDLAPSLDMWCDYLPSAKIYGFDIQDFSRAKGSWEAVVRGDQSNRDDLKKVLDLQNEYDVIIDDALHASLHQQITFSYLFPHVSKGGVYIIEDLHFQPYDETDEERTLYLLQRLSQEGVWGSKYAKPEERSYIEKNVKEVLFFDSMKLPRTTSRDAFCVIKKN